MKKIVSVFLTLILCFQFIIPIIAVAVTTDGESSVSLANVVMDSVSTKNEAKVTLTLNIGTNGSQESIIRVSNNFVLKESTVKELIDGQGNVSGTYQVQGNTIKLSIMSGITGKVVFSVDGGVSEDIQDPSVLFSFGKTSKELLLPSEWLHTSSTEESSMTTEMSETATTDSSSFEEFQQQQVYRAAMNVADIYSSLSLPDDFLTSINLTFENANGDPVTVPTVEDTINFNFTFVLKEEVRQLMQEGDYYTIQLPNTVKIAQQQTYPLSDADGIQYASVTINTSGVVTITFTDQVTQASNIKGGFIFTGKFNKSNISGPGDVIIIPPTHEELAVPVTIKPNYTGSNIAKAGSFDRVQNPNKIIWIVDINMEMNMLTNAEVSDVFPAGTVYESVKVYKMNVDFSGNIIANSGTLVDASNYTVDGAGKVTFVNPITHTYRIEYTTTINDSAKPSAGGSISFFNDGVTLTSATTQPAKATATVVAKYGKEITKSKGSYSSANQTINWVMNYNYGEKTITNGVITDTFQNPDMTLVAGSLKLFVITFAANGSAIKGSQLLEGTDYQLISQADGFQIKFLRTIQTAILIDYQTGYDGIISSTVPIGNTVTTSSGQTSTSSGSFLQQNVIKKLGKVDYNLKTVSWDISINLNKYTMNNWTFTDTASVGLSLQTNTFKIYDQTASKYLVEGQDYTFNYDFATIVTSVVFINSYSQTNHVFKITYTDNYNPDVNPAPDVKFVDTARVDWTSTEGKTITSTDSQTFQPNEPTRYNGLKSGAYNAITKRITWSIAIDYRDSGLQNGKIVDPLTAGQKFVAGSIKIYNYTIGSNGEIIKGSEITPEQYQSLGIQEPSSSNSQTMVINIPNNVSGKYLLEFQTSLDNQLINKTYINQATYSNDNYPDYNLKASVTVKYGGEFVKKTAVQDSEGFAQWSATINGSQSTLYDTTIVDTPSSNQAIDLNSVKLFETSVNQAGDITKGTQLVEGQDYTVDLTTDNSSGQQRMTIKLINDYLVLKEALILTYKSMVFLETNSGTVTNKLSITSKGATQTTGGDSYNLSVVVTNGGGSASGVRGSITIKKVDELGQVLPLGGTFELLDKNKQQVLRSGTVDSNGLLKVGSLPYGDYILRETNTLTNLGYTISQELVNGIPIKITAETTQGTPLVIQNKLGSVQLIKVSESGKRLSNAEFQLEKYDEITMLWHPVTVHQPLKTADDGILTIKGLSPGKYRLTEKVAPTGYVLNSVPVEFNVVLNQSNQLIQQGMSEPFVNYRGNVSLKKINQAGHPLQNSSFDLYLKGNDTTVIQTAISDVDGVVLFTELGPGEYVIKEKTSPTGYIVNTTPIEVSVPNQCDKPIGTIAVASDFINYKGSVELTKFGNSSSSKVPLEGIQFDLEDSSGQIVNSGSTDMNGKLKFEDLSPGTYYFVEKNVGIHTDYLLNSEKSKVVIEANAQGAPTLVKIEHLNYQGSVKFKKINSQGVGLKGAEFTLYKQTDDSVVKSGILSGNDGMIEVVDLAPGHYYLKETKAPVDGSGKTHVLNNTSLPFEVPSSFSGIPEVIRLEEFKNFKGSVELTKFAVNSSGKTPLEGITFDLENESSEIVYTGTTGTDGKLKVNDLSPGTYYFVEKSVGTHTDFILNSKKVEVVVEANAQGEPAVVAVEHVNYQGSIEVQKHDELGKSIDGGIFELRDKGGNVIEVTDSFGMRTTKLTSLNGKISATGLVPGEYYLVETEAPDGYILEENQKAVPITINSEGKGKAGALATGELTNYRGSVLLNKLSMDTKQPLENATFDLYSMDGTLIKASLVTDGSGKILVDELSPGEYYFSERVAPEGYELSHERQTFTINESATGQPEQVVLTMTNKLKPKDPTNPSGKVGTIGKFGEQTRTGLIIVGLLLTIAVIGYAIWKKKKQ